MTVSLGTAQRGTRIPGRGVDLSSNWLRQYIEAVDDAATASLGDVVPPMAVATQSVRALLEGALLPGGAIHASEHLNWCRLFRQDEKLRAEGIVDSRLERRGWVVIFIRHEIIDEEGEPDLDGKASIVFPTMASAVQIVDAANQSASEVRRQDSAKDLASVTKLLTQEKIDRYAEVSGDHNPLHIDPEFATTTQFGGTIAHGMLVLAYISEMMTGAFGEAWLTSGRLKVRFRGAARPGDRVTASGRVIRVEDGAPVCEVECRNQSGDVLITGEAEVAIR